jgi:hypothetical protein
MAYDRGSILQRYPKEITNILKATTADPKDETARLKVATTLARGLSFAKLRTGEDRSPADTELYKLATVIRQAKSRCRGSWYIPTRGHIKGHQGQGNSPVAGPR